MVRITLPDGSQREFQGPVSVSAVANSIGTGLGRAALAGRVGTPGTESRLVDTSFVIDQDSELAIITAKDADGLDLIRQVRESVRAAMPIIIVSGDADVKDAIAAMHLSVVDFLLKPIDTAKLLGLVRHELGIEP